ncbi:restriction endonuclease subunit S [Dorea formicigenerans]|uniref:restriction endonuclease subunit S n=1 Tax=Dorea formicigenerans TaxID=39486 RepID=UPI0011C9F98F|nr:restriction endonuclease subunit S [Dorea formicigenerans]
MEKPKIRFKGYQEDWEQRKLGDVFQEYSEKKHPELPALTIIQGAGTVLREESERKLQYDKSSLAGYKMVREDDFIVHLRSFEGGLEKSNHNGLISPAYHTFHGDEVDSRFYYPYFRSYEFIKHKLVPHVYGIRDGRSIDIDGMKTIEIPWTSYEEQKKIGDYIESLDTLITLHQRKCEEIKTLKKYMLQKMFPQNGQSVPQIRFSGFTEDWEQRKLNEIADKVSEKNKNNEFSEPFTNSAEQGIISQKDYFDREIVNNENLNGYYIVRNDDFIYNPRISVTAPVGPINRNRLGRNGVMSPLYTVFRTHDIDNLYLEFYFKTTKWHRFMKLNGDSGARFDRFTISSTQFMEMPIPYPTLEEQQKIGEYFDSLDHLITLHQQKCDELRNIKKFMLQNMFI